MASSHDDERGLPATWPFTFAGLLLLLGLSWFCLGFAMEDLGEELAGHYPAFFTLVGTAVALILGGTVVNLTREHRRRRSL